jgi:hypothetical protein
MHLCFVTLDWRNLPCATLPGLGSWLLIALMSDIDLMSSAAIMHWGGGGLHHPIVCFKHCTAGLSVQQRHKAAVVT